MSANKIETDRCIFLSGIYEKNNPVHGLRSGTTANRPELSSLPIGYQYFDTTLGKPIWKRNASTWVDANGTAV